MFSVVRLVFGRVVRQTAKDGFYEAGRAALTAGEQRDALFRGCRVLEVGSVENIIRIFKMVGLCER